MSQTLQSRGLFRSESLSGGRGEEASFFASFINIDLALQLPKSGSRTVSAERDAGALPVILKNEKTTVYRSYGTCLR